MKRIIGSSSSKRNEEEYRKVVFKEIKRSLGRSSSKRNNEEYRKVIFKEKRTKI